VSSTEIEDLISNAPDWVGLNQVLEGKFGKEEVEEIYLPLNDFENLVGALNNWLEEYGDFENHVRERWMVKFKGITCFTNYLFTNVNESVVQSEELDPEEFDLDSCSDAISSVEVEQTKNNSRLSNEGLLNQGREESVGDESMQDVSTEDSFDGISIGSTNYTFGSSDGTNLISIDLSEEIENDERVDDIIYGDLSENDISKRSTDYISVDLSERDERDSVADDHISVDLSENEVESVVVESCEERVAEESGEESVSGDLSEEGPKIHKIFSHSSSRTKPMFDVLWEAGDKTVEPLTNLCGFEHDDVWVNDKLRSYLDEQQLCVDRNSKKKMNLRQKKKSEQ